VETVVAEDTWLTVRAVVDCARSRCPGCGAASGRCTATTSDALTDPAVGGRTDDDRGDGAPFFWTRPMRQGDVR